MTVEVTEQSAYLSYLPQKLSITAESISIAIFVGTRVTVSGQSAFIAMFPNDQKRRRISSIMVG